MRPWVSRVWVIQEVALPSKSPIILARGAWSYLDSLHNLVAIIDIYHKRSLDHILGWVTMIQLGFLCLTRKVYQGCENNQGPLKFDLSNPAARLNSLLGFTQGHCRATLPHDNIYGLLGLVGIEALPPLLMPDYNRPYPQVCQEYARFVIENTRDLSLLLRPSREIGEVPSWVPDFRQHNTYWRAKNTEKNLSPIVFSDDGNRMTILGFRLGSCVDVFAPQSEVDFDTDYNTDSNLLLAIQLFDSS
jgi:hypothetical protein